MNTKTKVGFYFRIWLFGIFLTAVSAGGFFVFARPAAAATEVSGSLLLDQTWTKAQSPYVVKFDVWTSGIRVEAGATLTIEPGVVVKFERGTTLSSTAGGKIIAVGTSTEPIIFTASTDDTIVGDTNGDGAATQPEVAFWMGVRVNNPLDQLEFVEFRYGDLCINSGVVLTIRNNKFFDCGAGIYIRSGFGGLVSDNEFTNTRHDFIAVFSSLGLPALEDVVFERNRFSGWGSAFSFDELLSGQVTIRNNEITNNRFGFARRSGGNFLLEHNNIFGNLEYGVINLELSSPLLAQNNWWGDASGPFHPTLNPDGLGNEVSDGILFDPWLGQEVGPPPDRNPVIIIPGIMGTELFHNGELVWLSVAKALNPLDPTDKFLDVLAMDENGDSLHNIETGNMVRIVKLLNRVLIDYSDTLIKELLDKGYEEGTDLFVLPYDWRLDVRRAADQLNDLVTFLTSGGKKADIITHSMGGLVVKQYLMEFGKNEIDKLIFVGTPHAGAPKTAKILIFGEQLALVVNFQEIKKIARNMPSVYELLPDQDYFDFSGYLKKGNQLLDYNQTKSELINQGLNSNLITQAESFHLSGINQLDFSGIKTFNINGCNTPTLGKFGLREGGLSVPIMPEMLPGDGTVPLRSSTQVNVPAENTYFVKKISHDEMMTQEPVRNLITAILTNSDYSNSKITQAITQCKLKGKHIGVFSPVDIKIFDQNGNYAGPNEFGSIDNNIPGAAYEVLGDEKFVFLPTDEGQVYNVELDSTDTGSFDLKIADFDETEQSTVYYNNIEIVPDSFATLEITDTSNDSNLQFNFEGDGTFSPVSASAILNPTESADLTPPLTEIKIDSKAGTNGWYRSKVKVSFAAVDDNSGILKTKYSLDEGANWQEYTEPFVISSEGAHEINFFSVDRAGNREEIQTEIVKLDLTAPEVMVSFDVTTLHPTFAGLDNLSEVELKDLGGKILLTDEAGNETELQFKRKESKVKIELEFKKIKYNGRTYKFDNHEIEFKWSIDKKTKELDDLVQELEFNKKNSVSLFYKTDSNKTVVKEKIDGKESKSNKLGPSVLKIKTSRGNIVYEY